MAPSFTISVLPKKKALRFDVMLSHAAKAPEPRLYRRILVGYDGSESSIEALKAGRKLALMSKGNLFVAAVQYLPSSRSDEAFEAAVMNALRRYQESFYHLRIEGMDEGLRIETIIALGDPVSYLTRKARQLRVSLLIIGATGFTDGEHGLRWSGCEQILPEVTCPVLITP